MCGVPQQSLFLIYIKDLADGTKHHAAKFVHATKKGGTLRWEEVVQRLHREMDNT